MNILIIIPKISATGTPYDLPIGIGYISSVLKQSGHRVSLLNLNHYDFSDMELLLKISSLSPDIICTGGMSLSYKSLQYYIRIARDACPNARIIVGGIVVTSQAEVVFSGLGADVGVIGEGEQTIQHLISTLASDGDLSSVEGIIFQDGKSGRLVTTPPRPLIQDLDTLPWPDYEGMEMDTFITLRGQSDDGGNYLCHSDDPKMLPIITSRGCPFKCTFCCHELIEQHYRTRSMDDVIAEVAHLVERFKINSLFIYDDLFALDKNRIIEFCERVKPLELNWTCSLRVNSVDEDLLRFMRESGCKSVGYGIESMSPDILRSMKKKITVTQIEKTLQATHDVGLAISASLIFFDPAETLKTFMESLSWYARHPQYIIRLAQVSFQPGSRIYEDAVAKGLIADRVRFLEEGNPEINATGMDDSVFKQLKLSLRFFSQVIGITGKLISFSDPGGNTISLKTKCPHCNALSQYKKIYKRTGIIQWISCRFCYRRYRVPLLFTNGNETTFDESFMHPVSAPFDQKIKTYQDIYAKNSQHYGALFEIGKLYKENGNLTEALSCLSSSLIMNSFNPEYHKRYAENLNLLEKHYSQIAPDSYSVFSFHAQIHESQAQLLESAGVKDVTYIQVQQSLKQGMVSKSKHNIRRMNNTHTSNDLQPSPICH